MTTSEDDTRRCPLFGSCGGCATPDQPYPEQILAKKKDVERILGEAGLSVDLQVHHGNPWGYRNRMDFAVFEGGIGLRQRGSYKTILPVLDCPLSNDGLRQVLAEVWRWFRAHETAIDPYRIVHQTGTVKYAVIRSAMNTGSRSVTFVMNGGSPGVEAARAAVSEFARSTVATVVQHGTVPPKREVSVVETPIRVKGDGILEEKIIGRVLRYDSQSFFQNNTAMIEKLVSTLREWIAEDSPKRGELWDLFGGAGTFGVSLGDLFRETRVLDLDGPNILLAQSNLDGAGVAGRAIHLDASKVSSTGWRADAGTVAVLDPPRSGLHPKALAQLGAMAPPRLYYVSCNPAQFAREWSTLRDWYGLDRAALFDLFPQTPHVEMLVSLSRK